ncbi:hypothetical protein RUM44_008803 [Polyplax serrata]|uniref:Dynein axonemal intermediate chain 4 n=1 Tax=Polyplax serrata TaxID=468196 RepID=A0ABR1BD84_POLSC
MERILGCPIYREAQLNYKHSFLLDPMEMDIQFTYSVKFLWAYETTFTAKKPVISISINSFFPDIIAVGYGKFLHIETDRGYICVWSAKNIKHPERFYKFQSSVLCVDFAKRAPNLLAAGFLNGDLLILDISTSEKKVAYSKNSILCNTYEMILFTKWCVFVDIFGKEEERLMITTGDGRVIQLRRRLDKLVPFQMMRITKAEGKVKGIECLRKCEAEEITMIRFPAAQCIVYYPNDNQFYLVSGNDGIIHKCSVNYFTQHLESFMAHSGPVYALKFSPFCGKIFFSCGADGAVRLWVWDVFEPVITLTIGPNPVEDAAWSPRNSTVIASISDCNLYLWDLRRKTYYPASTIVHPQQIKFCTIKLSSNVSGEMRVKCKGSDLYHPTQEICKSWEYSVNRANNRKKSV